MKKLLIALVAIGLLSGAAFAQDPRCAAGMARGVTKYCGGAGDRSTNDVRLWLNKALSYVVMWENSLRNGNIQEANVNFTAALNQSLDVYTRDRLLKGFADISNYYYNTGLYWDSINASLHAIDVQESNYAGYWLTARGYHALGDDVKAQYYLQFVRIFAKGSDLRAIENAVSKW